MGVTSLELKMFNLFVSALAIGVSFANLGIAVQGHRFSILNWFAFGFAFILGIYLFCQAL